MLFAGCRCCRRWLRGLIIFALLGQFHFELLAALVNDSKVVLFELPLDVRVFGEDRSCCQRKLRVRSAK